ncbi:MAG: 4Fe-4S dicluster domain-containing protein [Ruminococcaceae bacterium]|nr:4Fe-4S dicluster domain-containing protein [Oscillospiraceae bacterium]
MAKGIMYVDGRRVPFDGEKNVLQVIRNAGIEIPTFCYYSELSVHGACRMCVVENEWGGIEASCSMEPKDQLKIKTNTKKLLKHRRMILELLLAAHCRDCTICSRNGKCKLQKLAVQFGISKVRFNDTRTIEPLDETSLAIDRDLNKCILCGDCVRVCDEIMGMGVIDFAYRGSELKVTPAFNRNIIDTDCIGCGQCAAVCPTGAITVKRDIGKVWDALHDENKRVVFQIAPAVRVAIGEEFHMDKGLNVMGKLVASLKRMGVDEVFDTTLAADLTVVEESNEFIERLENNGKFPMFTSCCPGWINFIEHRKPELSHNISSCKSPMEMFGAVLKEYYKEEKNNDGRDLYVVAVMPCSAKKIEAGREEFTRNNVPDVDCVITTQELATMIKESGIRFTELEEEAPDMPFGIGSGAGVIFGTTGGVAEAVIRRCHEEKTSNALSEIEFCGVRGMEAVKEATLNVGEKEIKIAVVHGLKNAQELLKKLENNEVYYDLVEVMACPGGCVGGAGQPLGFTPEKVKRAKGLYNADKVSQIKHSESNPTVLSLYDGVLKNRTHELLHVHYNFGK